MRRRTATGTRQTRRQAQRADGQAAAHAYGTGRDRLLTAAREVFGEKGYRGATTREIADCAGLTEPMVFRHFGSKAALFEEAAVAPVIAFMDEYVAEWGTRDIGFTDPIQQAHDFISRLLGVMDADRQLLLAILAAGQFDETLEPAAHRLRAAFGRIIALFEEIVETELTARGLDGPDRPAYSRLLLGITIALSLHGDWLAIGGLPEQVSIGRMLDEAARTAILGVAADGGAR